MVLDDIPHGAGPVVPSSSSPIHPLSLGHRNLDVIHVSSVEERFKNAIAEPKCEEVLNRLLTQVMIDSVDLFLSEEPTKVPVSGSTTALRT